jgi:nitroreductase
MDFFQVVQNRCSMRTFHDQPVEREKIQQILKALNCAPSGGNMQAYEVYVVTDAERRKALSKASWDQESLIQAPLVLVFCKHPAMNAEKYGERGRDLYAVQDATIACTFAMLSVVALDLSCVWVGAFNDEQVQKIIGAPEGQTPVAMLPIGYPGKKVQPSPRRALKDIIHEVK